ncbi:hypothetical protein CDAR_215531 [Caerostris darwini]|uniref:Transmembrane protein n=1 Tax=Caerostris darwini TaxID=1538125 RepID=A0AAV4X9C7_9ARAC|nr:hypothetical protein CDAR_215531 [Caerostris darwini]
MPNVNFLKTTGEQMEWILATKYKSMRLHRVLISPELSFADTMIANRSLIFVLVIAIILVVPGICQNGGMNGGGGGNNEEVMMVDKMVALLN